MDLIVFAGPSLGGVAREDWPQLDFRPPAACGDIALAIARAPRAIGLIDGCFETCASPWHKEILWGLSKGIDMVGGASLGALRAAELADFGMRGVGRIFEAYRTGLIEDDAEVAVLHGPAEIGYPCLTEALVNVRAALKRALDCGIIARGEETPLLEASSAIFYKDRTWAHIRERALTLGADAARLAKFSDWLIAHPVDAKREDALELLSAMTSAPSGSRAAGRELVFVDTIYFADLRQRLRLDST